MGRVEEIRAKADLVELVSEVVELKQYRDRYRGCCPFHKDNNPSFTVDNNLYYCFGCGDGGDAIKFVQQTKGLTFGETLEYLGDRCGIQKDGTAIARRHKPKLRPTQGIKPPQGYIAPIIPDAVYDPYVAELFDDVRTADYGRLLTLGIVPSDLIEELRNDVGLSNL